MHLNKKELLKKEIFHLDDYQSVVDFLKAQMTSKTCILLNGELAAGKTTFVQIFCQTYSLKNILSPTFSLQQIYSNLEICINHFDLYRLNSPDDVETSGLWDVLSEDKGLVFIEWPSRISMLDLPLSWKLLEIHFDKFDDGKRVVTVSCFN